MSSMTFTIGDTMKMATGKTGRHKLIVEQLSFKRHPVYRKTDLGWLPHVILNRYISAKAPTYCKHTLTMYLYQFCGKHFYHHPLFI